MAKGGYRAGAGRPRGIKETRPRRRRKPSGDNGQEQILRDIKAKAQLYEGLLRRIDQGGNLSITEKRLFLKLGEELAAEVGEKPPEATETGAAENLDPLTFMLRVMRDSTADPDRRARAAIACLPFCHPRKGEGSGKEDKKDRAKAAGEGRFAAGKPPAKVIDIRKPRD